MLLQRTFKKNYTESLLEAVRNGQDLDKYGKEHFDYDESQVVMIPNLAYPEGLLDKMIPTTQGDCESAIALYEAYPNLTPLQAADRSFWIYLAHADLFKYVQARHPKVKEAGFNDSQYILNRWFAIKEWDERHPLASLWWFVHQTIDENNSEKYKYTRFLFSNYNFRSHLVGYYFARYKEAMFGYFDFLMDNPEIMSQFFQYRHRFLIKHFNKLGGTKLLSVLPRESFYKELNTIKEKVLAIDFSPDRDDQLGSDIF